jgi:hypothetical protein
MANFKIKRLPPIRLVDLLKKRKTTLKQFLDVYGIVAYSTLLTKCDSMGVSPPSEEEFKQIVSVTVSSPQEGVVVLDPPPLLKENTGEPIMVDDMGNVHVMPAKMPDYPQSVDKVSKKKEKIEIDESIFITSTKTFAVELSGSNLGEATSVEDDIDSSVLKLSTLKKSK